MSSRSTNKSNSKPRSKTTYSVAIYGEDYGLLAWRGYRLAWIMSADERVLFKREIGVRQAREYIARTAGVPKDKVMLHRNLNTKG